MLNSSKVPKHSFSTGAMPAIIEMGCSNNDTVPGKDDQSVFLLVTRLSEKIAKTECPSLSGRKLKHVVRKARTSLYGTLLGKYHVKEIAALSHEINHMSPLSWIIGQRFVLSNLHRDIETLEIDNVIREAFRLCWHEHPHPIVRMLICLANTCDSSSLYDEQLYEDFSLSKIGFTNQCKPNDDRRLAVQNPRIYPTLSPEIFKPPPWMSIKHSSSLFSGYCTSFPFSKRPGEDLPLLGIFNEQPSKTDTPTVPLYHLCTIQPLTGPKELSLPPTSLINFEDEGYFTPMTEVANQSNFASECDFEDQTKVWSDALHISLPQLRSWETLGNLVTHSEPSFLSGASLEALHYLSTLVNIYQDVFKSEHFCDPKPTSRVEFLRGMLLLMIGIESEDFPFNKDKCCFVARKGMWLEGYSVNDTHILCQDMLFCGTNFRRLENLSHSSTIASFQKDGGMMVKSLIDCVQRWTQFYRGAVLSFSSHFQSQGHSLSLYELLEYLQPLKQQVACFSDLCSLESCSDSEPALPGGVELLAHIYTEASKSNCQQSHLLYSALKSCCEVYLQCLQQWIFLGDCPDLESNEFFVHKDPAYSLKRDRSFWLRAFILEKKLVPVFLQGLEIAIFDCGRAMNLLQLCSPHHPLCVLLEKKHPTIHCCLYKSDMDKVISECARFEEEAQKVCGNFVTVSDLLEEEKTREAHLHLLMQKAEKDRDVVRTSMKIQQEKQRAEIRAKQNADLREQILQVQQRKAAEKEQQRIEDEQYLEECQRLERVAKILQEEERQKLIAHYKELEKVVDKQNLLRQWQMKRLKLADKRQTFLYEDSLRLAKSCQLLEKRTPPKISLKVDVTPSADTEPHVPQNCGAKVPPALISPSLSPVNCGEDIDDQPVSNISSFLDLHNKAAAIKARVLQIEYGLGSEVKDKLQSNVMDVKVSSSIVSEDSKDEVDTPISQCSSKLGTFNEEFEVESKSSAISDIQDKQKNREDIYQTTELERNKTKVITEDHCGKTFDKVEPARNASADSGIVLERVRNRQRVLGGEFSNTFGFEASDASSSSMPGNVGTSCQESKPPLSDLQKNRMRVLGEEFNILTGEFSTRNTHVPISVSVTKSDSGVELLSRHGTSTSELVSDQNDIVSTIKEDEAKENKLNGSERPKMLSVSSSSSNAMSPLPTPHGLADTPVFTSPFKGTNNLPNGLPLASPLVDVASEKMTHFHVNGIPLMLDIADSFLTKFDSTCTSIIDASDAVDQKIDLDIPITLPKLESSLQTCLLLPLRVQYRYVSAALLHFFLVDLDFLSHLKSLRSYFLMQDGEFGRHLTVKLFSQMYQVSSPDKLFNFFTLNNIVKEALASSQGTADTNHQRLCLSFIHVPHHFSHSSLNALDSLQLSYNVKWPLNLLLTSEVLEKYNVIFLFLVRLKRVAWLLQEDFIALKKTARGCLKEQNRDLLNSPQYHQVQMIRHNMSQFVQATLNYVSSCVLHASWTDFAISLKQATTVDHIYNAHTEYIKRLLRRCLLNNNSKRVEAVVSKILYCIIKFHGNLRVRPWQVPNKQHDQSHRFHSTYLEHPNIQQLLACSVHFKLQVCKLLSYLERLISPPNQQQHLAEYLLLLNLNGFYKSSDYLKHAETVHDSEGKSAMSSHSVTKESQSAE